MTSRLSALHRLLKIDLKANNAAFVLGPRKAGKTTYLKQTFPKAKFYDLLDTDLQTELALRPKILREQILAQEPSLVVIDEVQKVPELLDEIHWCLENTDARFILCGSSARKLKTVGSGVLGGRAWRYDFFPWVSAEIGSSFDLDRALNHGLIPKHYLINSPDRALRSYVIDYLDEEIRQESQVRKLPVFHRFLTTAAQMNGELLNYANVARDCGVSSKTVRAYYEILKDTLFGFALSPWTQSPERRMIETERFYLFDPGVIRFLKGIRRAERRTAEYGRLFETWVLHELRAYWSYHGRIEQMAFWRTSTGFEVDVVIGRPITLAVEIKASDRVDPRDFKGLRALAGEAPSLIKKVVVCLEKSAHKTEDGIDILPWQNFVKDLWSGRLIEDL